MNAPPSNTPILINECAKSLRDRNYHSEELQYQQLFVTVKLMNILAIETSGSLGTVALQHGEERIQLNINVQQQQTATILRLIDELLEQSKLKIEELDFLAFSAGPGSFTGIRIALGVIQGIALATSKPVIAISSLQCLAQTCWRLLQQTKVIPCINAYMDQVYWGCYELDEQGIMQPALADQVSAPEKISFPHPSLPPQAREGTEIPNTLPCVLTGEGRVGVGNGWQVYAECIPPSVQKQLIHSDPEIIPQAYDLLVLAEAAVGKGKGNAKLIEDIVPFYLREKGAWRKIHSK
jgi:tRNA threonylcarbamoyladenosine biosynthesis protein TsaB